MSFLKDLLFGKTSQQQQQQQSTSNTMNVGGNAASSFGVTGSNSITGGSSSSNQQIAFEDVFAKLFGDAGAAAGGVNTNALTSAANVLFSGGTGFLGQLTDNAGIDALTSRLTDTTARDANISALGTSLGDFFNEQVLPGITSAGVGAGTLGGGREGVRQAQAAKAVAGQFSQGVASILSTDQAQRDQAATSLAGLTQSGAATGLASLDSLLGIKTAGETAPLSVLQQLASIYGGPTVLGSSSSSNFGTSSSFGEQGSESYGFDFGQGSSQSTGSGSATGGQTGLVQMIVAGLAGGMGNLIPSK